MKVPRQFSTMRGGGEARALAVRPDMAPAQARPLLERVAAIEWHELYHAYGPAVDVPGQLAAAIAGDDGTRAEAWWNLGGNIHHQGTIFEATVPAVPILLSIAGWLEHPDRRQALVLLREIGAADGVYVWRYGAGNELLTLVDEQERLYPVLRAELEAGAEELLGQWDDAPEDVRRALLWLLSVLPEVRARHEELVATMLPERHRRAWTLVITESAESQEDADAVFELEGWVYAEADA